MIVDVLTRVSSAQAFTGSDEVSTSSYDLGNVTPKRDVGSGEPLAMFIAITTLAADGGSGTFAFRILNDTDPALATSVTIVATTQTFAAAALPAGTLIEMMVPSGQITKRYLGAQAVLGGTTPTVSATIWFAPRSFGQFYKSYAAGYIIE